MAGFAIANLGAGSLITLSTDLLLGSVPPETAVAARESLAGAVGAAVGLPERVAVPLLAAARQPFTSGLHGAALISAVLLAAVVVAATLRLREIPRQGSETS